MGIETQAILPGHLSLEEVSKILAEDCKLKVTGVRSMHRDDYKVIEFVDTTGQEQALNVFLNSYAASDYVAVYRGKSTLLTLEFSPSNFDILSTLASATGGLVQRANGEPWKLLTGTATET